MTQTFNPVPERSGPSLETEAYYQLAGLVASYTEGKKNSTHATVLEGLTFLREPTPGITFRDVYEPILVLVLQGEKIAILGGKRYSYGPAKLLVVAVNMPVSGMVVKATPNQPYLAIVLKLNLKQLADVFVEVGKNCPKAEGAAGGLSIGNAGLPLIMAMARLVRLLGTPQDLEFLVPLAFRELYYHLLKGSQGEAVRQIVTKDSALQRVARVITQLKENLAQSFQVDDLAEQANMSPASFYRHFKNATSLSPVQYQKQLRLLEARRIMLAGGLSAASAAYQVGYDSPSQFSREYTRLFGTPPERTSLGFK